MNKPKILIETNSRGICKVTLQSPNGKAGLRLLKNSLPALRLFNALIPTAYGAATPKSGVTGSGGQGNDLA